ncbi:MAG: hypothetical protein U0L77_09210, partial [Prevotellamassilia sp.]|nr:hypothetical protein [Prevotellamassilia sp.]
EEKVTNLDAIKFPSHIKHLVFDPQLYTTKEMLLLMEHSNHKRYLSVFSPTTEILVTGGEVFD